ncbi:hypothetical protein CRENBAI_020882 [Crenichthys baileyi]|uniref:Small monomeric GTPase n=1 Tax=Crenichthys baileyi TaxID=28760 RepID=A0AAV9S3D9_9TELE
MTTLSLHNSTFSSQTPIFLVGNKLDMDRYRQHIFYEAVRRAKRGNDRSSLLSATYVSEGNAQLGVHTFSTMFYKELPAQAGHSEDIQSYEQTEGRHNHPAQGF